MGADFSMSSVPGAAAPFTGAVAFTIPKPQPSSLALLQGETRVGRCAVVGVLLPPQHS
jgi:hypothetical protein